MGLAVATKAGRLALEGERRAGQLFETAYPNLAYCSTPFPTEEAAAAVDGLIVERGTRIVVAVVEAKGRQLTHAQLMGEFGGTWLITEAKLIAGRDVAKWLGVPFYGWLYLVPDDLLLSIRLADERGQWVARFEVRETVTRQTVNGGEALRHNAYVNMDHALLIGRPRAA